MVFRHISTLVGFGRRLLLGLFAAYGVASLFFGGTRPAETVFYILAAGWCALLWFSRSRRAALPSKWTASRVVRFLPVLERAAVSVALTLILAEFSLRLYTFCTGNSLIVNAALDAYRLIPGQDYGFGLHGNNLGYPGPAFHREKRPGICRIAALGDSFAIGPAVPFADNYLNLLESRLANTEVYNFGVSGAGLREFCQVLHQQVWTFQPDFVLVSVFIGHDLTETLPLPRYLDPRRLALYGLLTAGGLHARAQLEWVADRLAGGTLSAEEFRQVEARRLAVCLQTAPPGLEKKWQRALGYLERIISDCQKHQIPVAFVLIADEYQVNPDVLAETCEAAHADPSHLDLELPQRRLRAFFGERDVPCLDLRPAFIGVPNAYAPRNTHWNERGNRLAAERIADWLRELTEPRP